MAEGENTIGQLKKYLGTPENPVTMEEFKEFWNELSEVEKVLFKNTKLPLPRYFLKD